MSTILMTGFEPFGGSDLNPSAELVRRLSATPPVDFELHAAILPVDAVRAPALLREWLAATRPDWCLMLGQAEGRAALSIERVAVNLCDFGAPDNAGNRLLNAPIAESGPAAYFATLPVRAIQDASLAVGVPAELSLSAGAFLCNMVFYTALHAAAELNLPTRCGFLHVPALPAQIRPGAAPRPTMALETMETGLRAMLTVLAAREAHAQPQSVAS